MTNLSRPAPWRSAAFFDLDKTIIAKSSALVFSRSFYAGGLMNRRSVLRSAYAQFVFLAGRADHDQMEKMRAFMSTLVAGWDVATVRDIIDETLHSIVEPLVYEEALNLIRGHQRAGRDVVIVSASGREMVEPIGQLLGVDLVIATTLEESNGQYTGGIEFYAYGENKAAAIAVLADEAGYDLEACYGYSDSVTDVHMLDIVGHAYAVNPDKELRKVAEERGWPVLNFDAPVALSTRVALPSSRTAWAAVAAGSVAASAVVLYVEARRRAAHE